MSPADHTRVFPNDAIFILGAGRFGGRAARVLNSRLKAPIWLVDKDEQALSRTGDLRIPSVNMDAIEFLSEHLPSLKAEHMLVPSIPLHLAFEWLRRNCGKGIQREDVPRSVEPLLPNTWMGSEGSMLVSYANFLCPDDCSEPADHCTVTGERRDAPLHEQLQNIHVPNHRIHVIRSRQLAPGVGGYRLGDLLNIRSLLERNPKGKWLLATACRCHGIITAFSFRAETQGR